MLHIIFEFVGGPNDGQTLSGQLGDASDAERYYLLTNHGAIGQRFKIASDYAVDALAKDPLQADQRHHFQQHRYVVTHHLHENDEVLVRAEYVEPETEKPQPALIREHLEPSSAQPPSMEAKIQQWLERTAVSMAESYSHAWPADTAGLSAPDRFIALHLAHVLLNDKFSVLCEATHSQTTMETVGLLGIAPGQDWFLATEFCRLDDTNQFTELSKLVRHLESFWLHSELTIKACQEHVDRVAKHCHTGLGLVVCLHSVPESSHGTVTLDTWSACHEGNDVHDLRSELGNLAVHWHAPTVVRSYANWATYYLLGLSFPIPH